MERHVSINSSLGLAAPIFRAGKTYRLPDGDVVVVLCKDGDDTWCVRRADDTSMLPAHRVVATSDLGAVS